MTKVGIRELKNSLSKYVRRAQAGERVLVTDRGEVVAVLTPPPPPTDDPIEARFRELEAQGLIKRQTNFEPFFKGMFKSHLPPGTAQELIDADREERF